MYRGPGLDHSTLSPSGRVSKRARAAALERARVELFGPNGLERPSFASLPMTADDFMRRAREFRELAAHGMKPLAYKREAERCEKIAAAMLAAAE